MAAIDLKISAEAFIIQTTKSFDEVRQLGLAAAEQSAGAITKVSEDAVVGTDIVYVVKRVGLMKVMVFEVRYEPGAAGERSFVILVPGWYMTSQATVLMFIPVGPKDAAGYPSLKKFSASLRALLEQDAAAPTSDSNTTAQAAQPQPLTPTAEKVASGVAASSVALREPGQVDVEERPTVRSSAKGRTSMMFGLLSPLFCFVPLGWVLGFGAGVAAISLGIVALRTEMHSPKAIPKIGIVGGAIGLAIAVLTPIVGVAIVLSSQPNGGDHEDSEPQTCADFLVLSGDDRASVYSDPEHVQTYSATGAESVKEDDLYARDCPGVDSSTALSDLLYGDATEADCEVFKALSPDIQQQWLDALYKEQYYELGRLVEARELIAACDAFNSGNIVAASNHIDLFGAFFMAWETETDLGYREKLVLSVQPLISGENIVADEFVAGSACGFDPAKDAAIPLQLFIENATEGQAQALAARFTLAVTGDASDLTTTAYLEANYSSGPVCSDPASDYNTGAVISTLFQDLTDAGGAVRSSYFVIVKDYFSPRYPQGAVNELASYVLESGSQISADDPVISASTASISLDVSAQ